MQKWETAPLTTLTHKSYVFVWFLNKHPTTTVPCVQLFVTIRLIGFVMQYLAIRHAGSCCVQVLQVRPCQSQTTVALFGNALLVTSGLSLHYCHYLKAFGAGWLCKSEPSTTASGVHAKCGLPSSSLSLVISSVLGHRSNGRSA